MKKILFIFGTRPEAIKMAPLLKKFSKNKLFECKLCITAQHRKMLDDVLDLFEITPSFDLDITHPSLLDSTTTGIFSIFGLNNLSQET